MSALPSRDDDGSLLGDRYRLEAVIGEGSFCLVYRAFDTHTEGRVAVKLLKPATPAEQLASRMERFHREVRICSDVQHPGVVRLLDTSVSAAGDPFAVFELIDGRTLRECLEADGAFTRGRALRVMTQVLAALDAVHARGIVHRDLKPENIMIAGDRAVLLDFGFAADSGDESEDCVAGTPQYAAPELLRGEAATVRSDLYSWGLILLECLTGKAAIELTAAHEAAGRQLESGAIAIPREAVATGVSDVLRRAVAKDASDRPESAAAILRELERRFGAEHADLSAALDGDCEVVVLSCRLLTAAGQAAAAIGAETESCIEFFAGHGGVAVSAVADRVTIAFGLHSDPSPPAPEVASAAIDWVERAAEAGLRWSVGMHAGKIEPATSRQTALMGPVALEAQRLDGLAPAARVLVSAAVAAQLPRWPLAIHGTEDEAAATALRLLRRPAGAANVEGATRRGTFIGRPLEMKRMTDAWSAASTGQSSCLLLRGEAGIGKSRLLEEFRASLRGADWIETRATPEGQSRPFQLVSGLMVALGGSATNLAARYGLDAGESVPILGTLLGEPLPSGFALPLVTPDRFKEMTLQVAVRVLLGAAADYPAVVILDDLHWADSASVEFVTLLLGELSRAGAPLMLILAARPEFQPPWPAAQVGRIEMVGLDAVHVENLIRESLGGGGGELVARFARACQGNPLLAGEAATLLRRAPAGSSNAAFELPENTNDLLTARIASLSPAALALAQTAAVLGREFLDDVLAAVANQAPGRLRDTLGELVEADLLVRHQEAPAAHRFRHDLLRDSAYASIPAGSRGALHSRIATAIRSEFPEYATQRPAELALHFERGGQAATAAELWHQAGTMAMTIASYLDARQHFARGLGLLADQPASPVRAQRELALTTALATAHLSTEGFGAAATREGFSKARVMCTTLGREAPLEIVGGIFGAALASADNEETAAILPMFESMATRTDQPMHCFAGHQVLGVHACWSGQHERALEHTSVCMDMYRRSSVRDVSWEYGFGLYCYGYGLSALYHRGFSAKADAVRHEMIALAESSRHPYCVALALGFATTLTGDLHRPAESIELATRLLAIAAEQHLYLWSAFAMCAQGQALVQLGRAEDGITPIRMGVGLLETLGFSCSHGYYLMYLVEALIELGEIDEALAVADQGLAFYQERWTRFAEPNMLRLRGIALEASGENEGAREEFERAIQTAQRDGSRAYEQRAKTSLANSQARGSRGSAPLSKSPHGP
jgi:tetratricopeptide (TPR) repeat protein